MTSRIRTTNGWLLRGLVGLRANHELGITAEVRWRRRTASRSLSRPIPDLNQRPGVGWRNELEDGYDDEKPRA